jgi:hypothetical protein
MDVVLTWPPLGLTDCWAQVFPPRLKHAGQQLITCGLQHAALIQLVAQEAYVQSPVGDVVRAGTAHPLTGHLRYSRAHR